MAVTTVLLSLCAAAVWGGSDFLGGLTSRAVRPFTVVLWVNAVGVCAALAVALATGAALGGEGLAWSAAAGLASAAGFVAFYGALAAGSMSLVAPVAATGSALPALIAVAGGEEVSPLLAVGLACAFAGSVLAARPAASDTAPRLPARALVLAVLAAIGIGGVLALLQQASDAPGSNALTAVAATRVFALLACVLVTLAVRAPAHVGREHRRNLVVVGVADTAANALFALASTSGADSVASVLSSLYPVTTVLLSRLVLSERLSGGQGGGVALALCGVALVSAA